MDCHLLDLLLVAASPKSHNEPEFTRPAKDKNNNSNNNNNKNYNINKSNLDRNNKSGDTDSKDSFPCDPGLMSQRACDKSTINSSIIITRETETSATVTAAPMCTTALGTIESQPSTTVSSISEPSITVQTATTASQPCATLTAIASTATTASTRSSTRSSILTAAKPVNLGASLRSSSGHDNNNKYSCNVDFADSGPRQPGTVDVTPKQDTAKRSKGKRGRILTGNSSSGVNPLDRGDQDSYPRTENICDGIADNKIDSNSAAVSEPIPITERNSKTVVIAPPQESSVPVSATFGSLVSPSSVALAVAPITPRTTDGNYSAGSANKPRHAEITSVSSGNECQTASPPPASEAANTTATTASTTATTSKDNNKTGGESNANKGSGSSREEGDPGRESLGEEQQKLVVPGGADQGGDDSGSLSLSRPSSDRTSESISSSQGGGGGEDREQQQKRQQQLPMNKRRGEEEGESGEKKENKEVLESTTPTSPPPPHPSSSSSLPLPPTQEGELKQPAAADTTTTSNTSTTTTTTTTGSAVASIHGSSDDTSIALSNKIVSHPDPAYCNTPTSGIPCTTTSTASLCTAPSSSSSTPLSSSSSSSPSSTSSLLVGNNVQPLKLTALTSAKHGSVFLKEETPPKFTVQNTDTTTTTTAASAISLNATIVQGRGTDSVAGTMCGPSEDKVMPNSSGEPNGSATGEKNADSTTNSNRSTLNLKTTPAPPATMTITQTLSSLSHKISTTTTSTATATTTTAMATKFAFKSTSHVKSLIAPNVGPTLEKELAAATSSNYKNPSIATASSRSLHESSQPPSSSQPSSTLPSSQPSAPPSTSPPLLPMPVILLTEEPKLAKISALQDNLSKGSSMVTDTKILTRTSATIKAAPNEGSAACGNKNNHNGSDDSASSQSSPNLGIDSPDSFVALPQTGFESSEFEATEDSNSNNSGHVGINFAYDLKVGTDLDCAFDKNVLGRRCESLVSENTCDMEYDRVKSLPKVCYNEDTNGTSSKDFRFGSNVYRNIYGPFESGYDCTFSVQNKDLDHILDTSSNKIGSSSGGFVNDLLRCTTAIADDHSYCWSVSKTQETESLLRDAHPCDDEISDSSSLDDIPDQQESLSFLAQKTFSKSSSLRMQNQKNKISSGGAEKSRKINGATSSSTTPPNSTPFTLNPASKFLVDLPSSANDHNNKAYHAFDQKSDDDRKLNGLSTPVKFYDNNSVSLTSPKITPLKTSGGRGSLQASPKVGCFRIGTFGSISNLDWDENSDTSSSVGSMSREKFTYRRKVDFTDKSDGQKMSLGEPGQKGDSGGSGTARQHTADTNARNSGVASMVHILHDHDYCMRTTISPLKSELAKELLSGTKLGSSSSKLSNINSSKGSNSSSNSLTYSSSSSSSSPNSASYTGITPLTTPSASTEAKCLRKGRNNSATKFVDGTEPLQESSSAEKSEDAAKLSDPNCDAARTNESKLKITGSFQNDYVYFLNKTTRSRRRISHEILPDKNQVRNYSDIVIPHLTDADIEALKRKRLNHINHADDLPVWKSSHDAPGELEADNRLINTVLSMENLCSDPGVENVLPGMIDSAVVSDNFAANPEQYLTPEEMDIVFNAVKEVESTNYKYDDEIGNELSPASILNEDQMNPCLADVGDHKNSTDKSDISTMSTSQSAGVSPWSSCNSPAGDLTKSEVLTTDNDLLDLENMPIGDNYPMMGTGTGKFKGTSLGCSAGSGLPSSDLNNLCTNNSNSSLTDDNMSSLEKFDLLNNSDLFPEPAVDTSNDGNAPWIVTVTMFWNDLPAIMRDNQPYIRLVDIHKQILPAKDTGILKKRCQLLGLEVLNCTEFQRYFLVQYGRAYNSKSTLVISKDEAKILIGYYVNPPTRIPKGEGCIDDPGSPGKRITKTNGSLVGRIKKHGRLIGSRKHPMHKMRNTESQMNKEKLNGEKLEKEPEEQQQPQLSQEEQQQQQEHPVQQSSPAELTSRPRPIKRKKERLVLAASVNGKSRLRHKKINFLNLIRGETGTSSSSATTSSPAAATVTATTSDTLPVVDLVNHVREDPDNASMVTSTPEKHNVDIKCKTGFKNRISASQKVTTASREQDVGALECNGRVGSPSAACDPTAVRGGNQQKKKQRNGNPFSAVSNKIPPASKWKNSRNSNGLDSHSKSSHLKKLKSKAAAATNGDTSLITDNLQSLCPALLVYHEDAVPQGDPKSCMQPGKLFLSLYTAKNAKCIKCTTCAKVFSVDEFVLHQHLNPNTSSKLVVVSAAQSLRFRDDSNESHQSLWKNFMTKRKLFEFEGHEGSRVSSPLSRTPAGAGASKGPATSSSTSSSSAVPAALNSPATERNSGNPKSSSTYRVSNRKRKQKQFYPIENYDFKSRSMGHSKDSSTTLDQFGQWGGKARGANSQSNVGCSPTKKALTLPVSGSFPSYSVNAGRSTRSHNGKGGGSLCENVVTLKNEPELLSFTALENDDEYN